MRGMTDLITSAEAHLATGPLWQRSRDVAKAIGCSDARLRAAIIRARKRGREPFATKRWISLLIARYDRLAGRWPSLPIDNNQPTTALGQKE